MTLCRITRMLGSLWLDDPDRLPGFVRSHLGRCPACRERLALDLNLAREFQAAGAAGREPLPPFLLGRVRARLRDDGTLGTRAPMPAMAWPRVAWAGAVLAAVLVVGVVWFQPPEPGPAVPPPEPRPGDLAPTITLPAGESWVSWGQRLQQPLDREIHSALADSRSALIALVENFVPEPSVAAVTERANGLFPAPTVGPTATP